MTILKFIIILVSCNEFFVYDKKTALIAHILCYAVLSLVEAKIEIFVEITSVLFLVHISKPNFCH